MLCNAVSKLFCVKLIKSLSYPSKYLCNIWKIHRPLVTIYQTPTLRHQLCLACTTVNFYVFKGDAMILFTSDVKKVFSLSFTKEPCKMNEDLLFDLTTFFALVSSSAAAAIYLNARNYFKLIFCSFHTGIQHAIKMPVLLPISCWLFR